jgi:hypothetical protein
MGAFACILSAFNIGLGWVYLFMGIMIGSAVFPIWCCLTWSKATCNAALTAAFGGQASALISWFVAAKCLHGEINVLTLGTNEVMLTGNLFALFFSALIMIVMTYANPDNYDFAEMNAKITLVETNDTSGLEEELYDPETLTKCLNWITTYGYFFTFLMIIVWPCLTLPVGVFPREYFNFWISIAITWGLLASAVIIGLPLWEGKEIFARCAQGIIADLFQGGFQRPEKETEMKKEVGVAKYNDEEAKESNQA